MQLKSGQHLVMLNSNLWFALDDKVDNHSDPAGQFVWLEDVLNDAEEHSYLVSFYKPTWLLSDDQFTGV